MTDRRTERNKERPRPRDIQRQGLRNK